MCNFASKRVSKFDGKNGLESIDGHLVPVTLRQSVSKNDLLEMISCSFKRYCAGAKCTFKKTPLSAVICVTFAYCENIDRDKDLIELSQCDCYTNFITCLLLIVVLAKKLLNISIYYR